MNVKHFKKAWKKLENILIGESEKQAYISEMKGKVA